MCPPIIQHSPFDIHHSGMGGFTEAAGSRVMGG